MMIKRFVGKISDNSPEKGLIKLIERIQEASSTEIILSEELLETIKALQKEKLKIKQIINPFYDNLKHKNTKDGKKKINELIDLGKFIYYAGLESKIEILECNEQPDFIIKFENDLIGIEHTGIFDDDVVAKINTLKKTIRKCQDFINNKIEIKGLYNIIIDPSKLKPHLQLNEKELIDKICNYIICLSQNKESNRPDFIADIIHSEHQILELTLGEDYWLKELTTQEIINTISKKEAKIDNYKSQAGIKKCWLLMVIDGASSASSFDIKLESLPLNLTSFDKVFIFDNFKGTIIKGEKTNL